MPQFDFYSFYHQVILTTIAFSILYFFYLKFYIVIFSKLNKVRIKLTENYSNLVNKKSLQKKINEIF